jgi:hypothetical protein
MTMKIEINNRWVMALLVLNLLVVAGFWVSSFQGNGEMGGRYGRGEGPKKEVIKRLQFEDWQVKKYEGFIALHRKAVGERERKINALRQTLFEGVGSGMDSTETMQICTEIGSLQAEIHQIHVAHFKQMKGLCEGRQVKAFEEMVVEFNEMFGHRLGGEKMPRRR